MNRRVSSLCLLLLVAAVVFVYWPGTSGDFVFDDRPNILDNPRFKFKELTADVMVQIVGSGDSGTLKRPIPMLSFAFNVASTGFQPFYFKVWNLAIHVFNTLLVFVAVKLMMTVHFRQKGDQGSNAISVALGAAALWGLHPINVTSVLYVVQRMNSLCGAFMLLAVICYLNGRMKMMSGESRAGWIALGGAGVSTILALLSKENAVLLPLMLVTVEWTLLGFSAQSAKDRMLLRLGAGSIVAIALFVVFFVVVAKPGFVYDGYIFRDFRPEERLWTQSRVLFFYLQLLFIPASSRFGLFHDDFPYSTAWLAPVTTIVSCAGLVSLLAVGVVCRKRQPVLSFAILWFLVGHSLEASALPLEMIHEHRNYIPSIGPLLAASYYLCTTRFSSHGQVLPIALVCACIAVAAVTFERAYQWGNLVRHAEHEVENHPDSQRSVIQLGRVYFTLYENERREEFFNEAVRLFRRANRLSGNQLGGYVGIIRIYFVAGEVPPRDVVDEFLARLAREPAAPSVTVLLQNISNCNMFEYCKLADEDILRMYDALLKNQRVHPTLQAVASVLLAQYVVDHMGDGFSGIQILEIGKRLQPTVMAVRRNLVRLYRLSGQLDRATAELAEARRLDRLREIGPELDQEELLLREAIAKFNVDPK